MRALQSLCMGQEAIVYFDGSCRGNPGPAGYGVVLHLEDQEFTAKDSIGEATNNRAEYRGLIAGLELARQNDVDHLIVRGDSELIINQMTGRYNVNDTKLRELHAEARELAKEFSQITYNSVDREEVDLADKLAREASKNRNTS